MENIHLLIRGLIMLGYAICLVGLFSANRKLGCCLVELEELHSAFHKQAYGKDDQEDSEHLHGASESDKRGRLSVKVLCEPLLCFYNPKKLVHLLLKPARSLCRIFSKPNIEGSSGPVNKVVVSMDWGAVDKRLNLSRRGGLKALLDVLRTVTINTIGKFNGFFKRSHAESLVRNQKRRQVVRSILTSTYRGCLR
jgi:hypothetical protein